MGRDPGPTGEEVEGALSQGPWQEGQGTHACPDHWLKHLPPYLTDLQQAEVMNSSGFTFRSVQGGRFLADTVGERHDDKHPWNERPC